MRGGDVRKSKGGCVELEVDLKGNLGPRHNNPCLDDASNTNP